MATGQNPQLTPQELQKLIDLYKRVDGLTQSAAANMANQAQAAGNARAELERLNDVWNDFIKNISYAEQQFARIADKIKGQATGINKAAASYDKLRSIAAKVSDIQDGIRGSSEKELKSLKEKLNAELKRLETAKDMLERQKQNARQAGDFKAFRDAHKALIQINATLADQENYIAGINDAITEEEEHLQKVNKSLGLAEAAMKGMSKIPFLGNLPGIQESMEEVNEEINQAVRDGKTVSKTEALGMAFKKIGPNITKALGPMALLVKAIELVIEGIKIADEDVGKLAKNMNLSYNEALKVRDELGLIADFSFDAAVQSKTLQESYMSINNSLGITGDIQKDNLITFTKLREQAGYTNEELNSIYRTSLLTGKSVESTTKGFLGSAKALASQKGLAINVKQLLKESATVSNAIKLSLGGSAEALAKAMVKAKEFGVTLDQADKMADSLLNFEDSISAELEAELLTGKQINLETARYYALQGDIGAMAEEINKEIGGSAEFSKMNRIQQEAYAKAVGMSREELANSLVEQEAMQALGKETAEEAKKEYDRLVNTYGVEYARQKLGNDELARQYEQQSLQERFNQSVEKLKEIFIRVAEAILPILDSLMEIVGPILTGINALLRPVFVAFKAIGDVIKTLIVDPLEGIKDIFKGIVQMLSGDFEQGLKAVGSGLLRAVLSPFQAIINGVISLVNGSIDMINYIPGVDIKPVGPVDLTKVFLADGGVVTKRIDNATLGEAGPEAVIPLNKAGNYISDALLQADAGGSFGIKPSEMVKYFSATSNQGASIDYDKLAAAIAREVSKIQLAPVVKLNDKTLTDVVNNRNQRSSVQTQ